MHVFQLQNVILYSSSESALQLIAVYVPGNKTINCIGNRPALHSNFKLKILLSPSNFGVKTLYLKFNFSALGLFFLFMERVPKNTRKASQNVRYACSFKKFSHHLLHKSGPDIR